ncbi:MAG: redoxin domain-containing protein [Bacteroidetes bacterium]|nr:redoxin domain-containing protein [Bacteroidota bacterium]
MRKFFIATIFAGFLFSACGQNTETAAPKAEAAAPIVIQPRQSNYYVETARPANQIQSNFPYDISLQNAQGDTLNSAKVFEKNGKPTVLMFWLTTCGPCRMELNAITEKYDRWKQQADFNLYAISTDFPKNYPQFISRVAEGKWQFPAYYDMNREFRMVMPGELNGLPQIFVLDKNGNIAYHTRKYVPGDEDKLFEEIRKLL